MRTVAIAAGIALLLYVSYRLYRIAMLDKDLDKLMTKDAVILDVRTEMEYKTGHIPGSVNIPLSRLHTGVIPLDTGQTIITCCSHGLRSVKAVGLLKDRGYKKVYNGGAWPDLEKLTEKKRDTSNK